MSLFYAQKRWGHGRLRQLAVRTYCRVVGHLWKVPWDGVEHCRRSCGGMRGVPPALGSVEALLEAAKEAFESAGLVMSDDRLDYITIQVDREAWAAFAAAAAAVRRVESGQ